MSRRKSKRQGNTGLGRLFFWTAFLGIVSSIALIIGQRILVEKSLPPIVSVGQPTPSLSMRSAHSSEEIPGKATTPVFSFYDVLTRPEIQDRTRRVQPAVTPPSPSPSPESAPAAPPQPSPSTHHVAEKILEDEQASPIASRQASEPDAPARYTLQVASHPTIERARVEMDRLRSLDLDPHVISANIPGQGEFYRVRIGKFHTMEEARHAQRTIHDDDAVQTFVTPL